MTASNFPKPKRTAKRKLTRREFVKRTTALTTGAAAFPSIIPSSALGADGAVAPSNRRVLGCIGVGGMGTGNMHGFLREKEVQVVAVADVDRGHRENAMNIINETYESTGAAGYNDFSEMLDRDDLDLVSIAVPDHWHAIPAIAASNKGLDIYAEKPLARTIEEGQAMVDTINRNGTVWQTGSWQRSRPHFRRVAELIRNGRIGEVHTVEVGLPTGQPGGSEEEIPVPDGFDYDFWLGPAPKVPYTADRCHWNFRWITDYSGGQLTDWAGHHCDIANWAMGTEATGPVEIEGTGNFPREGLWDSATNYRFEARYDPSASPVAPSGFTMIVSDSFEMGCRFKGSHGSIYVRRGDSFETSEPGLQDSVIAPDEIHLIESNNHIRNFLDSVDTREKTVAPIGPAHRAIAIAHLGNIAMQLGRKVRWNPDNENFIGDQQADRLLGRAMRGPWHL